MDIKKGVDMLCQALREDGEYYYSWQANIAGAFFDTYDKEDKQKCIDRTKLNQISNQAAKNFLDRLIK